MGSQPVSRPGRRSVAPQRSSGFVTDLAKYVSKSPRDVVMAASQQINDDVTAAVPRVSRTSSHWTLLTRAMSGDEAALTLWTEFEQATWGRRLISWSHRLRERLGTSPAVRSHAAPAPVDLDVQADVKKVSTTDRVVIPGRIWDRDLAPRPTLIPLLLNAAEAGPIMLREWLRRQGITYREWEGTRSIPPPDDQAPRPRLAPQSLRKWPA